MTPNTTAAPAPAPSAASETAKQLASFITRTGRPRRASRSRPNAWPLIHVLLAFFTTPAAVTAPGIPTPTVAPPAAPAPASPSRCATSPAIASSVPA
jgi:hypothetical protein